MAAARLAPLQQLLLLAEAPAPLAPLLRAADALGCRCLQRGRRCRCRCRCCWPCH